jgi:SAM-dependent methyltransferase
MDKEFAYNYGDYYAQDKYSRMRFDISRELLTPYLKDGVSILDIGCYDAAMFLELKKAKKNIDYTGIDNDPMALKIAQQRGANIGSVNFEVSELPFPPESFDIVIVAELLEHLRDPAKLLQKAKEMLKPGGVILISLPNECNLYQRIKVLFGKGIDGTGFEPGYHLHFPTLGQNKDFVSQYFEIISKKYWYHLGVGGFLGKFLEFVPDKLMKFFMNMSPSLLARGIIFLCQK